MSIRATVMLVSAAALVLGLLWGGNALYQAGWDARDAVAVKAQADNLTVTLTTTGAQIAEARETDTKLQAAQAAEDDAFDGRAARLDRALSNQEKQPRAVPKPSQPGQPAQAHGGSPQPVLIGGSVLDHFTLCLLNAERAGARSAAAACSPERTDEEVAAAAADPSEVTGADLARADLEAVKLFNDLARRHDGLVDWVDQHVIKPQTQRVR